MREPSTPWPACPCCRCHRRRPLACWAVHHHRRRSPHRRHPQRVPLHQCGWVARKNDSVAWVDAGLCTTTAVLLPTSVIHIGVGGRHAWQCCWVGGRQAGTVQFQLQVAHPCYSAMPRAFGLPLSLCCIKMYGKARGCMEALHAYEDILCNNGGLSHPRCMHRVHAYVWSTHTRDDGS